MMMPTSSTPAIVPNGLRRVIASSSDAKVLACSLAADASSDPASAAPLAALPTREATVSLTPRRVFAASPPTCDARRVIVSFRLATSRFSLFISSLTLGPTCSGSVWPKVERHTGPDVGLEFICVVSLVVHHEKIRLHQMPNQCENSTA